MPDTSEVIRRLWGLCSILRDDGVTYHEYLTELTQVLFLKLAAELEVEKGIPVRYRWRSIHEHPTPGIVSAYDQLLTALAGSSNRHVRAIYKDAHTVIRSDHALARLLSGIDEVDWYRARQSGLGDIYEGLIEKAAQEARYGAGQYFTPRSVVEALVTVLSPTPADSIYDPAAGTGGFLVAAGLSSLERFGTAQPTLSGVELVRNVHRMGLMNLLIHGLNASLLNTDTLGTNPRRLRHSLCLTNPPFGVKGSPSEEQSRLIDYPTSNKQLAFLQHVYLALAPSGRAAVIVPDNVLFESGVAALVRKKLMDDFRLHTVLHLPTGIFYATGIRTSVLFFAADGPTSTVWFYDLRNGSGNFTKRRPIGPEDFAGFVRAFGDDPLGRGARAEDPKFRQILRTDLRKSGDRLDLAFRQRTHDSFGSPQHVLQDLLSEISVALAAAQGLDELLEPYRDDAGRQTNATGES